MTLVGGDLRGWVLTVDFLAMANLDGRPRIGGKILNALDDAKTIFLWSRLELRTLMTRQWEPPVASGS